MPAGRTWGRDVCIAFIENEYFGNVSRELTDEVMACFDSRASVMIRHGDLPERRFAVAPTETESSLRAFYQHLCGHYGAGFGEFRHFIGLELQRAASRFTVRLTPKPGGAYAQAGVQTLYNCNFFEFENGVISDMIIYYSNPQPAQRNEATAQRPTGYPRT